MLQDVKADAAICVDVRVEHFGQKLNLWRFVWIVLRELDCQVEASAFPDGVFRSKNNSLPMEERITARRSLNAILSGVLVHFF